MTNKNQKSNSYNGGAVISQTGQIATNPIDKSGLIAKINVLGKGITAVKAAHSVIGHYNEKSYSSIDYADVIKKINDIIKNHKDCKGTLNAFHNLFLTDFNASYTALGIVNEQSGAIEIRLLDKSLNAYSMKVFLSQNDNEIVKTLNTGENAFFNNSAFLKLPSVTNLPSLIIPVKICDKNICVLIVSDYNLQNHLNLYQLVSSNLGLFVQNSNLIDSASQKSYIDALTDLYSHRRFHELLAKELNLTESKKGKVSVAIFDINDMGQINREFGHSKGDEVIRTVANKIHECIKKQDIAARYGGDKISVILKGMSADEAKYMAEYITYSLSCCQVDDIGYINKVSVGISTYPDDSTDKEKLLILAEQAVLVSKTRGYSNGRSTIVSAQDYDFWNDTALNSFAVVMAKRHSQLGINFEDALVEQFKSENILSQNHLIEIVTSLAGTIDAKDKYTKDHSSSVSRYSVALAKAINLPDKEVEQIKLGSLLHDIGKIGIPEEVLNKPSKLTDEEFNIIKQHPMIAVEKILEPNPVLHDLIPIVKYHHEQWNGKGYPDGLKEEEIPLAARIVAIADTYHALISDRPYRKGMSVEKACEILEEGAGIQWDKELIRQFISIAPTLATKI